jgi:hypothetical protein
VPPPPQLLPPSHYFTSREHPHGLWPLSRAAELLALSNHFFARSATGCLSAVQAFVSTTPLACEPNLRTILDPSGLLRDQSLATTTKTHRQPNVFPNLHTRHNPRSTKQPASCLAESLAVVAEEEGVSYIVYHDAISPFRKAWRTDSHADHVDGYSKAPLTHKRAPITPWG